MKCWKCNSVNVAKTQMRVGRLRTTAEAIQHGSPDNNTYQIFLVCADCTYRWSPQQEHYLRQIVFNHTRNSLIADLAALFARRKQTCFVFVKLIEHSEILGLMVKESMSRLGLDPEKCRLVHGKLGAKNNEAVKKAICTKKVLVAVGTTVWGEGTDIPPLRWVINAKAGLPGLELKQLLGRALRKAPGKFRAGFVDFQDKHDSVFAARARARFQMFQREGVAPRELSRASIRPDGRVRLTSGR